MVFNIPVESASHILRYWSEQLWQPQ